MDRAGAWHCIVGIVGSSGFSLRRDHNCTAESGFQRAELCGKSSGFPADRNGHMMVADLGGNGSFGKILRINGAASGIRFTDAGIRQHSGLAAYAGGFNGVGNREAGIGQSLMHPGHDLPPDPFVVGGAASDGRNLLVIVTAGPYAGSIVRCIAHKPDIHVAGGRTGFSGIGHTRDIGWYAGGIQADAGRSVHAAAFHGLCQGVGQEKGRGILKDPFGLGLILQKDFSVVIQDLCEENRLRIDPAVGDGGVGSGEFQVGNALGDASQGRGRIVIRFCQRGDPEIPGVFHAQLGRYRLHHTADGHNVHRINDAVADGAVSHISLLGIPVPEGFLANRIGGVIVDRAQGGSAGVQSRRKGGQHLKGGAWLTQGVGGTV